MMYFGFIDGDTWLKQRNDKNALAKSEFTQIFSGKLNQNDNVCFHFVLFVV